MQTTDSPSKPTASNPTFDFSREKLRIDHLISQWASELDTVIKRREVRKKEETVQEARARGVVGPDEHLIVRRVIDRNIRLEKPEHVAYLEQSPRTVLFKSLSQPTKDTVALADWFTLGVRYRGWAEPWHRVIDATALHGCGFVEVRYDITRPFNLAIEFVPREALIFPLKLRKSIQKCETILRCYEYLPNELEDAVTAFGFKEAAVRKLVETQKDTDRETPIKVYKVFRKKDGIIYVSWYSQSACEVGWLKDPEPLSFGIIDPKTDKPQPVTAFPFFCYLYEFIEEEEFLAVKGRAARDLADQDALTQLWSAIVNGTNRAADINASFAPDPGNLEGQESQPIKRNTINGKPVNFWQANYPDPMILTVAQALSTENLQSAGKVDYAAQNRVDSRKTATEINSANRQSAQLSSINIVPLATCITEVYTFIWNLVQLQVLYVLKNPAAAEQLIQVPTHIPLDFWTDNYELSPAGDVEVIKRAEKIANLQADLPLFANTPIYTDLLAKYLELRFPDEAANWKAKLEAGSPLPLLQAFLQIMSQVPTDIFPPEQQQQIQTVMENAANLIGNQVPAPNVAAGRSNPTDAPPAAEAQGLPPQPSTSPLKQGANGGY